MKVNQIGRLESTACPEENQLITEIRGLLEKGTLGDAKMGKPTLRIEEFFSEYLRNNNWLNNWLIDPTVSHDDYAYNKIDWFKDTDTCNCGNKHRFFLEFFFDNRQAIGTNLLKFEIATKNTLEKGFKVTGIAVCGSKAALNKFGWDGGVGSKEEYRSAISGPYSSILKHAPVLFAIEE